MIHARKIVWHEGMIIAPYQFHLADRYFESLRASRNTEQATNRQFPIEN